VAGIQDELDGAEVESAEGQNILQALKGALERALFFCAGGQSGASAGTGYVVACRVGQ
jgi:hypothetical protein